MVPGQSLYRIAPNLCLAVAQLEAGEILRKAFVEPILGRGDS